MGGTVDGAHAAPLSIVIDDLAMVQPAAVRSALRAIGEPANAVLYWLAGANIFFGILHLLHGPREAMIGGSYLALGALFLLNARLARGWRRPTTPKEFAVSDEGLAVTVRGESSSRIYRWKHVRMAVNTDTSFVIIVGRSRVVGLRQIIAIPKPSDALLCEAIWTGLYTHMIAQRGLRGTPVNRLGVLRNTAFA